MPADRPQRAEHTEREIEALYTSVERGAVALCRFVFPGAFVPRIEMARAVIDAYNDDREGWMDRLPPKRIIESADHARDARSDDEGQSFVCDGCGERLPGEITVEHYCRSPQDEDHEAGIEAVVESIHDALVEWGGIKREAIEVGLKRAGLSPARDARSDTVAVEDVLAVVRELAEPPMMSDAYPQLWARINRARAALAEFGGRAATDDQAP